MCSLNRFVLFAAFLLTFSGINADPGINPPWGIAADIEGNLFFPDLQHEGKGALWKLDKHGKLSLIASDFKATNVVTDKFGNIYSSHGEDEQYFIKFKPSGKQDTLVHKRDAHEFFGRNCTITKDGKIVFGMENRLWTLDDFGNKVPLSDYHFSQNKVIFSDKDGSVFATDIKKGNGSIIKIDSKGKSEVVAQNLISKNNSTIKHSEDLLLGMGKDEFGALYVAETSGKQILKIEEGKEPSTFYKSENEWIPTGITFREGVAYILECHESQQTGPKITVIQNGASPKTLFSFPDYFKEALFRNASFLLQIRAFHFG
ncbi:MAG: hypothetical protein R2769_06095 [Saprospiraceae bacterium]